MKDKGLEKRWYVVNTYSGHESKVKQKLEMRTESMDMGDYIFQVIIPTEKVTETDKSGKEVEKEKKLFPGYVLVEMKMSDDAWYVVRNTPGVTGFIGSSGKGAKPIPLADEEAEKILKIMGRTRSGEKLVLKEGSNVKIVEGPFAGMHGTVKKLEKPVLLVDIDLFGQVTEVEVNEKEVVLEI